MPKKVRLKIRINKTIEDNLKKMMEDVMRLKIWKECSGPSPASYFSAWTSVRK